MPCENASSGVVERSAATPVIGLPSAQQDPTEPRPIDPQPTDPQPSEQLPAVTLYGDVDCNGTVDILDVITLNKNIMVGDPITLQGKVNADVDRSDPLAPNETDALNILKAVVELITLPL